MDQNYTIEYKEISEINETIKDICNLKWGNLKKEKKLIFNVNFNIMKENNYKRIVRSFHKLKDKFMKKGIDLSGTIIYVYGFDSKNKKHIDFINAIEAIMKPTKEEMYSYIYDVVCGYLDKFFVEKNACDFHNDICGEKRNTSCNVGCCRHFKNKKIGPFLPNNKWVICEYLKDKRCTAKCISCKLFTCGYLKKKGITFKLKNIFLIDTFFNLIQKYFIKYKVFTPKDKIIKLLLFWS